jgi:hypothetical protein
MKFKSNFSERYSVAPNLGDLIKKGEPTESYHKFMQDLTEKAKKSGSAESRSVIGGTIIITVSGKEN